ncbi:MAG TPA: ABC transporter permease, partial [Cyclobacteriaceae bacterium]|nr:ABC transporter permease [Cyclobacteriaceae bacterium]
SAVYNIFAFAAMVPLIFILPRMTSSMHPGSGGNPGFNMYDLDSRMRMVFYPAVAGWILLGVWIATLRIRIRNVKERILELEDYA